MNNYLESTIKGKRRKKQWTPQKTNEQPNKDQQKDNGKTQKKLIKTNERE